MLKYTICFFAIIACAYALAPRAGMPILNQKLLEDYMPAVNPSIIKEINSMETTWKAGTQEGTFLDGATIAQAKTLLGVRKPKAGEHELPREEFDENFGDLPESFDLRDKFPDCPQLRVIRDQSNCGSCWAFSAVEAMSDRYCIFGLNKNLSISANDMLACCGNCGYGCEGGYPASAWSYWVSTGLVDTSCDPYPFPSCDHHVPNSKNPCPPGIAQTPKCHKTCKDSEEWGSALHFGASASSAAGEQAMQQELMKGGSIQVAFSVYADFLTYKSGVYQHKSGSFLGGHAVKIIGWGVENGVKYWTVANSWNPTWGDKGYFKILRGADECGIEDDSWFGVPKN